MAKNQANTKKKWKRTKGFIKKRFDEIGRRDNDGTWFCPSCFRQHQRETERAEQAYVDARWPPPPGINAAQYPEGPPMGNFPDSGYNRGYSFNPTYMEGNQGNFNFGQGIKIKKKSIKRRHKSRKCKKIIRRLIKCKSRRRKTRRRKTRRGKSKKHKGKSKKRKKRKGKSRKKKHKKVKKRKTKKKQKKY